MTKYIYTFVSFLLFIQQTSEASTWEKLYKRSGADSFRDVHELSNGDFFAAGYTNSQSSNDTDGLAIRFNSIGDRLWTYTYNAPADENDGFYKGVPTSDGGFILCGFTTSSGNSDDALFIKLDSAGTVEWIEDWGGSDYERARDIIEIPGGSFIAVGYTSSSPAQDYDMFMLKLDANGNILWDELYGDNNYDHANTVIRLPDGGFLIGGVGDDDLYLVRTDSDGDEIWSNHLGTSGDDVIKNLVVAPGGDGFTLSGTTTGIGAGGEDAYLVRTDTGGNMLWSQYFGGQSDDGFQGIKTTSDGGYIGIGTSRLGPWTNPNIWLSKLDASGNITWQKYYGGDAHDHGYSVEETSDGGFIVGGHSRSFGFNNPLPDALIIKTDSIGDVQNRLTFTTVTALISPVSTNCGTQAAQVVVEVANLSDTTVASIPVTIDITGAITQSLTHTYASPVVRNGTATITFTTTADISAAGTYNFHCFTGNDHDVYPDRNFLDETIVINTDATDFPVITNGTHCGPGTVSITASSSHTVRWYDSITGGAHLHTGTNFTTPHLTADTTFYVQAGTSCPSARIPVYASIHPIPVITLGPDTVYSSQSNFLLDAGGGFSGYLWGTGSTSQTLSVTSSGTYCVTVTDSNSCMDTACVYVGFTTGINEFSSSLIKIYPQPSQGFITVEVPVELSQSRLTVFDQTGKPVFTYSLSNTKETIDLSFLTQGIYLARIEGINTIVSGKFIIDF